jgi:hypothetical protein
MPANASTFTTDRKKGGQYTLTSTAVTALAAVTTATTVRQVLQILSTVVADKHVNTASATGFATSVKN